MKTFQISSRSLTVTSPLPNCWTVYFVSNKLRSFSSSYKSGHICSLFKPSITEHGSNEVIIDSSVSGSGSDSSTGGEVCVRGSDSVQCREEERLALIHINASISFPIHSLEGKWEGKECC